jgi:hypothetical protein
MVWARRFWLKLQTVFRRDRSAQRLDDEMQFHLDQQIAENLASVSPGEARHSAMRAFGNPTVLKEDTRDTDSVPLNADRIFVGTFDQSAGLFLGIIPPGSIPT